MKPIPYLALTIAVSASTYLHAAEPIDLFDGKTLDGWTRYGGEQEYSVRDGLIIGRVVKGEASSYLCTDRNFGDFELTFEVKYLVGDVNSGCQIRSLIRREDGEKNFMKKGSIYGPQIEINRRENNNSGNIYGQGLGTDYLKPQKRNVKSFRPAEWNRIRVVARGPRIQTWINDEPVVDIVNEEVYQTNPRGMIGLQIHKVKEGTGPYEIAWRNIRITELDDESFVTISASGIELMIREFVRCMAKEDNESLRILLHPRFIGVEAGHPNVHVFDSTNLEKLSLPREDFWGKAIVSEVKSETSSTHPSVATASFVLTVPLAETQIREMLRMLKDPAMPPDRHQRRALEETVKAKQVVASMFAMLGRRNGDWKIICVTLP